MIGPIEKGIKAAHASAPPIGVYDGVDLQSIPRFIAYRAALLQQKLGYQYLSLILAGLLAVCFITSRIEIYSLYGKLRSKEYILAPGVQDFTPASPQTVSEDYVRDAVTDFLEKLGNVNPSSVDRQYELIGKLMSPELKIQFDAETAAYKAKIKADSTSELLNVGEPEIESSGDGFYHVLVHAKRDTYINNEYAGRTEEVIEMLLQLVPPQRNRPWYVQVNSLTRETVDGYRKRKAF